MTVRDTLQLAGFLLATTLGVLGAAFTLPWGFTLMVAAGFLLVFVILLSLPTEAPQPALPDASPDRRPAPIPLDNGAVRVSGMDPISMNRS
jgi:hypothetical protein